MYFVYLHPTKGLPENDWYIDGLVYFLNAALSRCGDDYEPKYGRAAPLLAVSLVGIADNSISAPHPTLLRKLFLALLEWTDKNPADVVFVPPSAAAFSTAQIVRRTILLERSNIPYFKDDLLTTRRMLEHFRPAGPQVDHNLSDEEINHLFTLAKAIRSGNLAAFVGSGLSQPAGLPGRWKLLGDLAGEQNINVDHFKHFENWSASDVAQLIAHNL